MRTLITLKFCAQAFVFLCKLWETKGLGRTTSKRRRGRTAEKCRSRAASSRRRGAKKAPSDVGATRQTHRRRNLGLARLAHKQRARQMEGAGIRGGISSDRTISRGGSSPRTRKACKAPARAAPALKVRRARTGRAISVTNLAARERPGIVDLLNYCPVISPSLSRSGRGRVGAQRRIRRCAAEI